MHRVAQFGTEGDATVHALQNRLLTRSVGHKPSGSVPAAAPARRAGPSWRAPSSIFKTYTHQFGATVCMGFRREPGALIGAGTTPSVPARRDQRPAWAMAWAADTGRLCSQPNVENLRRLVRSAEPSRRRRRPAALGHLAPSRSWHAGAACPLFAVWVCVSSRAAALALGRAPGPAHPSWPPPDRSSHSCTKQVCVGSEFAVAHHPGLFSRLAAYRGSSAVQRQPTLRGLARVHRRYRTTQRFPVTSTRGSSRAAASAVRHPCSSLVHRASTACPSGDAYTRGAAVTRGGRQKLVTRR